MLQRRSALVLAVVAALALVAVVATALVGGSSDDPEAGPVTPSASPTPEPAPPLAEIDTRTTAIARAAFCDRVAPTEVEAALGAAPTSTTSYDDGQSADLTGTVADVSHEFACGWTAGSTTARAWVFAPPVTRRSAADLTRTARTEDGCRAQPAAAAYGRPSVALVCRTQRGVQASFRGLYGDAWLTCTLSGRLDRDEALERADRWCSAVLAAVAA